MLFTTSRNPKCEARNPEQKQMTKALNPKRTNYETERLRTQLIIIVLNF